MDEIQAEIDENEGIFFNFRASLLRRSNSRLLVVSVMFILESASQQ